MWVARSIRWTRSAAPEGWVFDTVEERFADRVDAERWVEIAKAADAALAEATGRTIRTDYEIEKTHNG